MAARVLDGTAVAGQIRAEGAPAVAAFAARAGRPPGLGIVLVGDDPASQIYVRNKIRSGGESGLHAELFRLAGTAGLGEGVARGGGRQVAAQPPRSAARRGGAGGGGAGGGGAGGGGGGGSLDEVLALVERLN